MKAANGKKSLFVVVDWVAGATKNDHWFTDRNGRVRKTYRSIDYRDALIVQLKNAYQHKGWRFDCGKKMFVDVTLMKQDTPRDRKKDVANLIDGVCDAVKKAIEIDDAWYAGRYDWDWTDAPCHILVEVWQ